jgi:NodT family efflux transporter outer membrane factor (OMF) lipoprotein
MLLLLATACTTLGPDYKEPEVTWLNDWQPDLYGLGNSTQQATQDLRFWWLLFDDPVLNGLIKTARRNNPSLRIAGLRILESRAALGIANSTSLPQLQQLGASATAISTNNHGGISNGSSETLVAHQSAFSIGWELDFWGRFQRGIESADAAFLSSITAHQDLQVLLNAQVADLYFSYRTIEQRIKIAHFNSTRQQRSFAITEKLFAAGQGSELDLQQAKTQYLVTRSTIPDLERKLIQVRNALAALLGRPPGQIPELADKTGNLPNVGALIINEVPARLLLRRPDIRSAAWRVAAQSAQIGLALADYYPAISLLGSLGWSGNSVSASADTAQLIAGPSLIWNVFDQGRIRNNVRLQDARLQQSIESFQNAVLLAAREIDDAVISVAKTAEQQIILKETLIAAERSLELANIRYREGYANFQRVLDAQRSVLTQADRQLAIHGTHLSSIIQMYKALGGGWAERSEEPIVPEEIQQQMRDRTDWGSLLDAQLPASNSAQKPE